jgi:DNA-binding MarR family transcriptional regulator
MIECCHMATFHPQTDSFSDLIIEIFRTNGMLLEAGDRLTQPVGLSSARWQVLGVVEHGPISVAHVARSMGLARQSVQQTADGLEQEGFIVYIENPYHRRSKLMQLTPKGQAALDVVEQRHAAWAAAIGAGLAAEDLRMAIDLLRQIRARLDLPVPSQPAASG